MIYVHTQTKNSSNVPFDTDFIKFKIVDEKMPKRTAIQETVLDAVRSYNEVIEIAVKSTGDHMEHTSAYINCQEPDCAYYAAWLLTCKETMVESKPALSDR